MEILEGVSLAEYTSWLVGGAADWFCQPATEDDLAKALQFAKQRNLEWTILGGGTNVLVSDEGVPGLTISLRKFSGVQSRIENGRLIAECMAGTSKSELLKLFLKHKLSPALFLAGLPGDVGGGIVMNAGVAEAMQPREFVEIVDSIEVLRAHGNVLKRQLFTKDEMKWTYRHSSGWQPGIILKATISWPMQEDPDILQKVRDANKVRLSKQPLDLPSCGSVFVNPPGHKSAQLIDSCGLKGFQVGGAQVSLKHANFIVNVGGASAKDIKAVIEHVRKTVKEQKDVSLQTEVVWLGR